jgi:hypothetical protein
MASFSPVDAPNGSEAIPAMPTSSVTRTHRRVASRVENFQRRARMRPSASHDLFSRYPLAADPTAPLRQNADPRWRGRRSLRRPMMGKRRNAWRFCPVREAPSRRWSIWLSRASRHPARTGASLVKDGLCIVMACLDAERTRDHPD